MRIVLASSFVPFIRGGARFIVEWLEEKLLEHGHEVERFYLPTLDGPDHVLEQASLYRLMDLSDAGDRLIAFRPPAYVLRHPNKVLWFIHHIRIYYDMWGHEHAPAPTAYNAAVRDALRRLDTETLGEARRIYTNSQVVSQRLKTFNGVESEPLYPPIYRPERFRNAGYGEEIVVVCRMEPHKRQQLLIEAMAHVRTGVRLRLCGQTSSAAHAFELQALIEVLGVGERVILDNRWIDEDEKAELLAGALAVAYLPEDEDSYGYPSLEGAHAEKAVLTTRDAGGVLELVEDGRNGYVVEPEPAALAEAMDRLYRDRALAARMGRANHERLSELRIDWSRVVDALTA